MGKRNFFSKIGLGVLALMFAASFSVAVMPNNASASHVAGHDPAGGGGSGSGSGLQGPEGGVPTESSLDSIEGVFELFQTIVQWLLIFAVVIGVVFIIVGGIKYVTAGGDSEQATNATRMIAFAAVGIAIILLAFILVQLVANIVGVDTPGAVLPN